MSTSSPAAPASSQGVPGTVAAIRIDSGVEDGSVISAFYDPLLAKIIAHAPTRLEAARSLSRTLALSEIHGLRTNRDLLVRILRHEEFLAGAFDTGFLERHDPALLGAPLATSETEQLHAVAAVLAAQTERRDLAPVLAQMPSGWRNVPGPPQRCVLEGRQGTIAVGYRFDRDERLVHLEVNDSVQPEVSLISCAPDEVVLSLGSSGATSRRYKVHRVGMTFFVDGSDGSSMLTEIERFPLPGSQLQAGALLAPLPGIVVKLRVEVGAHVRAGETLAAIEAMKMEHEVRAGFDGTVTTLNIALGQQVEAGEVLGVVEPLPEKDVSRPAGGSSATQHPGTVSSDDMKGEAP